jgi:hypothetical protein
MHLRMPAIGGSNKEKERKEVIPLAKKMNCGCGCVPPGKTAKRKVKTETTKTPKKAEPIPPPGFS